MLVRFSCRLVGAQHRVGAAVSGASLGRWGTRFASTQAEGKEEAPKEEAGKPAEAATPKGAKPEEPAAGKTATGLSVKELQEKLSAAETSHAEVKSQLMYALADADNARRIARKDEAKARDFSISSFAKDMLEVSDALERAVEAFNHLPPDVAEQKKVQSILTGVKLSASVLMSNLGKHGIEKLEAKAGDAFDPNKHDALFNAPSNDKIKAGHITTVVKSGYNIKDRVLRAAQVGVAEDAKSE